MIIYQETKRVRRVTQNKHDVVLQCSSIIFGFWIQKHKNIFLCDRPFYALKIYYAINILKIEIWHFFFKFSVFPQLFPVFRFMNFTFIQVSRYSFKILALLLGSGDASCLVSIIALVRPCFWYSPSNIGYSSNFLILFGKM